MAPCLVQFRPVRDLKDTLLHEMIHAALFLGNVRDDGDHGPKVGRENSCVRVCGSICFMQECILCSSPGPWCLMAETSNAAAAA